MLSLNLGKIHSLKVAENEGLRKIFGRKGKEKNINEERCG